MKSVCFSPTLSHLPTTGKKRPGFSRNNELKLVVFSLGKTTELPLLPKKCEKAAEKQQATMVRERMLQ